MEKELFKEKWNTASSALDSLVQEKIKQSYGSFSNEMKLVACIEELAELMQALSKSYRQVAERLNLIEELGDLVVCTEILRQCYDIPEEALKTSFHCARRSVVSQSQDSDDKFSITLFIKELSEITLVLAECFIEDFSQQRIVFALCSILVCVDSLCQFYSIKEIELNKAINVKVNKPVTS